MEGKENMVCLYNKSVGKDWAISACPSLRPDAKGRFHISKRVVLSSASPSEGVTIMEWKAGLWVADLSTLT